MSLDLSRLTNVKVTPEGWTARCPVCATNGSDKSGNHLGIRRNGQFHCIVGSATDLTHNRNIRAAARGDALTDVEYIDPEPGLTTDVVFPEELLKRLLPDVSYWLGRGMREDVLRRLECGLSSKEEKGKLSGRSVFPVRDLRGRIMGFTGRLVTDSSFAPKWKHLFKSSKSVYPWQVTAPAIRAAKTVVLVESIGDLLALLSHDIKPVLCVFGLNLNSNIVGALVGAGVRRVIISLNRDPDPLKSNSGPAIERFQEKLAPFFSRVEVRLPGEGFKDWGACAEGGEAGTAELARFRAEVEAS